MKLRIIKGNIWRIYYWLFTNYFEGMSLKELLSRSHIKTVNKTKK